MAAQSSVHPVRDYLSSLKWDGAPRLDRWLSTYLGVEESNYSLCGRGALDALRGSANLSAGRKSGLLSDSRRSARN